MLVSLSYIAARLNYLALNVSTGTDTRTIFCAVSLGLRPFQAAVIDLPFLGMIKDVARGHTQTATRTPRCHLNEGSL